MFASGAATGRGGNRRTRVGGFTNDFTTVVFPGRLATIRKFRQATFLGVGDPNTISIKCAFFFVHRRFISLFTGSPHGRLAALLKSSPKFDTLGSRGRVHGGGVLNTRVTLGDVTSAHHRSTVLTLLFVHHVPRFSNRSNAFLGDTVTTGPSVLHVRFPNSFPPNGLVKPNPSLIANRFVLNTMTRKGGALLYPWTLQRCLLLAVK